ncbi:MAG: efflux RND transporter permease subunit [Pseudomonadales bacterium]|nr:efflux RND transporter permease subunit [Pseudomonadales bacterium]
MRSVVTWFIDNPIAAKLFMVFILVSGLLTFPLLDKEFFPQIKIDTIKVSVNYPGAGPKEVEVHICKRIEEAVKQLGGIKEIRSSAIEGRGEVVIELKQGEDTQILLNDIKANVDAIDSFPPDAESPSIVDQRWRNTMMRLQLSGKVSERDLKELAETIREELAAFPSVAIAELHTPRDYELGIEISRDALLAYDITFDDVAQAIRSYSFNQPAGKIRDEAGDITMQARGQAYQAVDFEELPIRRHSDGAILRVGDVAEVVDGFVDTDIHSELDGRRSLEIWIINQNNPNILITSAAVRNYVEQQQSLLPDGVELSIWSDASISYQGRLDTLIYNGSSGLLLVFIVLLVFLRPSLAFWVCSGIAVAFMGAIWLLILTPVSLNIISMFSFIMILGIVVDDAIIVGESIYSQQEMTGDKRQGAINGTLSVMLPVWFAVMSTMIFFTPFFFIGERPEAATMATPVILALFFSLFESLLLLPSHIANTQQSLLARMDLVRLNPAIVSLRQQLSRLELVRLNIAGSIPRFASSHYKQILLWTISYKRLTLLIFGFFFLFALASIRGGWLPFSFFPRVTSDYVTAEVVLPESSSFSQLMLIADHVEASAYRLKQEVNEKYQYELVKGVHVAAYGSKARVTVLLEDGNDRPVGSDVLARDLQRLIGDLPLVKDLNVGFTIFNLPKPIEFVIRSNDQQQLELFSTALSNKMAKVEGVYNIGTSLDSPSTEINFHLKPEAASLSVSLADAVSQVRRAFYGEQVQRIPRQREDVKVLVRYPKQDRSYEELLDQMYIATSTRTEDTARSQVPLNTVVDTVYSDGFKKIERLDLQRVARVSSDVHRGFSAGSIIHSLEQGTIADLLIQYPDVDLRLAGEERENIDFLAQVLFFTVLSMLGIFGVMAIMFRSYWQPLLVLTAVPFGFMGGVFGHLIVGVGLSMFSILGMMACAGVVVNDNVVLIDRINTLRRSGFSAKRAVLTGAIQRFRPILLTSVTTFLGLTPILLETSVQAQFLIPMVSSLSFGVLFATFVTLLFVPALYLVGDDIQSRLRRRFLLQEQLTNT